MGEWVEDAKIEGFWDKPEYLKQYLEDLEHDAELSKGSPWEKELADDIKEVKAKIEETKHV